MHLKLKKKKKKLLTAYEIPSYSYFVEDRSESSSFLSQTFFCHPLQYDSVNKSLLGQKKSKYTALTKTSENYL